MHTIFNGDGVEYFFTEDDLTPPTADNPLFDGLLAQYWLTTNPNDSSTNSYNGSLIGNPVFSNIDGRDCITFDGDGDQFLGGNDVTTSLNGSDEFTVSAWFRKPTGSSEPIFRTTKSVVNDAFDPYPFKENIFDDRVVTGIAGSTVVTIEDIFIWGYSGEGYKASQANYFHLLTDKGVFLTDAGTEGNLRTSHFDAIPEKAGNAFSLSIVKVNNDIYLYQNDENWHGGLHRWKINNLESINEVSILL